MLVAGVKIAAPDLVVTVDIEDEKTLATGAIGAVVGGPTSDLDYLAQQLVALMNLAIGCGKTRDEISRALPTIPPNAGLCVQLAPSILKSVEDQVEQAKGFATGGLVTGGDRVVGK